MERKLTRESAINLIPAMAPLVSTNAIVEQIVNGRIINVTVLFAASLGVGVATKAILLRNLSFEEKVPQEKPSETILTENMEVAIYPESLQYEEQELEPLAYQTSFPQEQESHR